MAGRLGRHDKGGGMGSAESESGGDGAEYGWKTRGRLKTPLTDGVGVATRQGRRSEEWCGYTGPAYWAAVAGTTCSRGKRPSGGVGHALGQCGERAGGPRRRSGLLGPKAKKGRRRK